MQVILTTKYQKLKDLVDSVSTSYKIQVTAGRVLALESTIAPEPSSSDGNSFGLGEFFTSTAEQGDLYVRGTTSQTTINVIATSSFSAGIAPFTGATGTTDGGGSGGSDSAVEVKVKYESNPNTNAFTDDEKEKLSKLSESSFEISGITHNYNNNQLTTSITDTNGTVTSNSVTIEAADVDDVTGVSMDLVDGTISTTLTKKNGGVVSSIPIPLPESNDAKSIENTIASGQLKTIITLTDDTVLESTPVNLPTGGGDGGGVTPEQLDEAIAGANEYADQGDATTLLSAEFLAVESNVLSIENGKLKSVISQVDGTNIESNEVTLPTGGSVNIDAPDNTVVKVIGGELVASGVIEQNGSIQIAPSSVELGAHRLSSIGDSLGVKSLATDQQRALLFQDITNGITQRPYVYKMISNAWENVENIPNNTGSITKAKQIIQGFGAEGYYIIKPGSLLFETAEPTTDFVFTIYDFDKKIFEKKYNTESSNEKLLIHDAIILDGAAEISFSVTDLEGNPIALKGSEAIDTQRFAFIVRNAERAYLAYQGEGGDGGGGTGDVTQEQLDNAILEAKQHANQGDETTLESAREFDIKSSFLSLTDTNKLKGQIHLNNGTVFNTNDINLPVADITKAETEQMVHDRTVFGNVLKIEGNYLTSTIQLNNGMHIFSDIVSLPDGTGVSLQQVRDIVDDETKDKVSQTKATIDSLLQIYSFDKNDMYAGLIIADNPDTFSDDYSGFIIDNDAGEIGFRYIFREDGEFSQNTSAKIIKDENRFIFTNVPKVNDIFLADREYVDTKSFLTKVDLTLNDNIIDLNEDYTGQNVFVHGSGLDSGLILDAANYKDYELIQITRASDYTNAAIPVTIKEADKTTQYLVQGTTTFGVFNGHWLILSDASVTLAEISQRAGFQQYIQIKAGQGMTSSIDQFGVMTLNVVGGGGGNPSFEIPDNTVPVIVDKLPVASAISVEFDQLISPYGQQIAGHILDSRGEVLATNSHANVTQPIDTIGRYSNPKIFKEVELEQPSTFINTSMHDEAIVHPSGQEIVVHSEDYSYIRTEPDAIHFRTGKIIQGCLFSILDNIGNLIYKHKSSETHNSNAVVYIQCPSLTLRANKSYFFIVTDLEGNPIPLLGSGDVQSWVFNYRNLTQHELLTDQDSVLPDVASFMHLKTLQVTDLTESSGITFNSNGTLEVNGQLNMQNKHILELSAAEHDHEATNLGQVKSLIANADFTGNISVDGQEVEDIQLNEDAFVYSYNPVTKVLHLDTKQSGGGSSTADGTVNPIVSVDQMEGYLVEFATADGKFIRSSNVKWADIQAEHERIWDKLDPAYKTAITAQTEAAANTLTISHTKHDLSQLERKVTHNRLTNDDQALRIGELQVEDARQDRHLNNLDIDHQKTKSTVSNHQVSLDSANSNIASLQSQQETINTELSALNAEVQTITALPLERLAKGEFETSLYIADSLDSLTDTSHFITPYGSEIDFPATPSQRTVEPAYSIKLKVDGVSHEALKLTATAIRAGTKPIKDVVDGVDAQDAATVNQLVPINEAISKIHDRLSVIEAMLGIISPPAEQFPVYVGRMVEESTKDAAVIKSMGVVSGVTESTLLTTDYVVPGHIATPELQFSYSVIAYPKGVVNPDPMFVVYNGLPKGSREHYELVIDGVMYIVLHNQYPDSSTNPISYKLVQ